MAIASFVYGVFYFVVRILGQKLFIPKEKKPVEVKIDNRTIS